MRRVLLVACIALLGAVGLFCSTSFSNAPDGLELIDSSRHNSTCASQSWLSAMRNTNTAQFKNPDYSIKCPVLTGGQRILELHAGYWDVVALVSFTGPLHATGQLAQDAQRVILCAAPLVVNEWGIPPSTPCSNKEWFSWTDGCTSNCIHRPNNLEARVPHWQRLAEPAHQRSIRVHNVQDLPSLVGLSWSSKQHSSRVLRPADLVVYVSTQNDTVRFLEGIHAHLPIQSTETLHAIILYGYVCGSEIQDAMESILPTHLWTIRVSHCGKRDMAEGTGVLVYRLANGIRVHGALISFESTFGAPVHLTNKEMFVESEEGAGLVYAVPDACLFRITNDPLVHAIDRGGVVWLSAHRGVPSTLMGLREGPMEPKVRSDWLGSHYAGISCGPTVLTTVVYLETHMLFYTIGLPLAEVLNAQGIPALLRFVDDGNTKSTSLPVMHPPMLHIYLTALYPTSTRRSRRYAAFQLEYYAGSLAREETIMFLTEAVMVWEYASIRVPAWKEGLGLEGVRYMPMCYHPSIEYQLSDPMPARFTHSAIFPGSLAVHPRRMQIVQELQSAGVPVHVRCSQDLPNSGYCAATSRSRFGVDDVHDAMTSAPILLNIHAQGDSGQAQLEVARLVPHLSNGAFIVSERGVDASLDASFEDLLVFIPKGCPRLTAEHLKPFVESRDGQRNRSRIGARARMEMRTSHRCELLPAFREAMSALVHTVYPEWFVQDNFWLPDGPSDALPCPVEAS